MYDIVTILLIYGTKLYFRMSRFDRQRDLNVRLLSMISIHSKMISLHQRSINIIMIKVYITQKLWYMLKQLQFLKLIDTLYFCQSRHNRQCCRPANIHRRRHTRHPRQRRMRRRMTCREDRKSSNVKQRILKEGNKTCRDPLRFRVGWANRSQSQKYVQVLDSFHF